MDEEYRRRLANDNKGYHWHSSICECKPCQTSYDAHNQFKWCACHPCQMHNLNRNNPYQSNTKGETVVSTVNFCDRCQSLGKSHAMGTIEYRTEPSHGMTTVEICPGCVDEFVTWLKSDITTTREKAYHEPWKENISEPETKGVIIASKEQLRDVLRELESGNTNE